MVTEETTDEGGTSMHLPFGGWGNTLGGAEGTEGGERPAMPFDGSTDNPVEELFRRMFEMQRGLGLPVPEELFGTLEGRREGHDSGFFDRMFGGWNRGEHERPRSRQEPKFGEYEKDFQEV